MFNLLNVAIGIFGNAKDWNGGAVIALMAIVQVAVLAVVAYMIISALKNKKATKATAAAQSTVVAEQPTATEQPTPIVVQSVVQPAKREVEQTTIVERTVERPVIVEKIVEAPVVVERIVERPVVVERVETVTIDEESVEAGALRYDKSFTARLIQSDDEIKHWYTELKNELLSYKTCKGRISWKRETFKANKQVVAMLVFRGKKLCLFLPLNPTEFGEEYRLEDVSDTPAYKDLPAMLRLKNDKRIRIAKELIAKVMEQVQAERKPNYVSEDFYVPYEGVLELINKGFIKREIRSAEDEAIFDTKKD